MTMIVVGIDLGLSGALACIDQNGLREVVDMPLVAKGKGAGRVKNEVNAAGVNEILRGWTDPYDHGGILVVIESVASMPGQGVAGMFSFGDSRGVVRGAVAARGLPLEWVTPATWKKHYGLPADKELARAHAIRLYPAAPLGLKKFAGRAEAILICRYGYDKLR